MTLETYKGRKLKVVKAAGGGLVGSVNGQPMPARYGVPAQEIIAQFRSDIDHVDQAPVDGGRWGAYMYAPGTYELCGNGHPRTPGEPCKHPYCQERPGEGEISLSGPPAGLHAGQAAGAAASAAGSPAARRHKEGQ